MPLRAIVDGKDRISINYSDQGWIQLKSDIKSSASTLLLGCCKQKGFPRTSSLGLKHFVHFRANPNCQWEPESEEHLFSKIEIIKACQECEWEAISEYSETNWRADVLARKKNSKIAFEVQWSKQTREETHNRQYRYKLSNVRGCWFFKSIPKELQNTDGSIKAVKEVPIFKIAKSDNGGITVQHDNKCYPLKEFVKMLLCKEVRFCRYLNMKPMQNIQISLIKVVCWKCYKEQYLFEIRRFVSCCGKEIKPYDILCSLNNLDEQSNILKASRDFIISSNSDEIKIGEIKERYNHALGRHQLSHGCYYCDTIFPDFFLSLVKGFALRKAELINFEYSFQHEEYQEPYSHWCISTGAGFCE